jgi:nicotinate-nucleotide adenylyltransferase
MRVAIFGGTFDPIHAGHLKAARAAAQRYHLDRILFMPSGNPPHKPPGKLTPFVHRYAMVALACAAHPRFVPSLIEAPRDRRRPHYSIETARQVKKSLRRGDRLCFLIGLDAFLDLPQWREPNRLLDMADFIVVSRPGFRVQDVLGVVRGRLVGSPATLANRGTVHLRKSRLHILRGVDAAVSSHEIRESLRRGLRVTGLLPALVEEYILKYGLYSSKFERGVER